MRDREAKHPALVGWHWWGAELMHPEDKPAPGPCKWACISHRGNPLYCTTLYVMGNAVLSVPEPRTAGASRALNNRMVADAERLVAEYLAAECREVVAMRGAE